MRLKERIMKLTVHKSFLGKQKYNLVCLSQNGIQILFKVAPLVAAAFCGDKKENELCRHLDGNGLNDHYSNLKWGSSLENSEDSYDHGTMCYGERSPNCKMTLATALSIRDETIGTLPEIGEKYGVSPWSVHAIRSGRTWSRAFSEVDSLNPNLARIAKTARPPAKSKAASFAETEEQ
jgi:hypothetical protein